MARADYPRPIIVVDHVSGTGLQPNILDISAFLTAGYPPVLQLIISNTATVVIRGALQVSTTDPPTLVDAVDVSGGGFTASDFYDLIPGIPFYQVQITANTGTVTVKSGIGPQLPGRVGLPQLVRMTTAATEGM